MNVVNIKKWLDANERSIEWLARQIKVSRNHLNQVMLGNEPLTDKMIGKIKQVING